MEAQYVRNLYQMGNSLSDVVNFLKTTDDPFVGYLNHKLLEQAVSELAEENSQLLESYIDFGDGSNFS